MDQRTDEWFAARCGKITASQFHRAMAKPKTKEEEFGKTAIAYMHELIAERDSHIPADKATTWAMKWGIQWEDEAKVNAFEAIKEHFDRHDLYHATGDFAFILHPEYPDFGCSPDFLVGNDALGEIKCPHNPGNHVRSAINTEQYFKDEYLYQIQGSLWITGRQKYFCATYDPRSISRPLALTEIQRDDEVIKDMEEKLLKFRDELQHQFNQFIGHAF